MSISEYPRPERKLGDGPDHERDGVIDPDDTHTEGPERDPDAPINPPVKS